MGQTQMRFYHRQLRQAALGTEVACPHCGKAVRLNPFVIEADWRPVAAAWRGEV